MNFAFSDEQEELRRIVRQFLDDKSPETAVREQMDTEQGFDPGPPITGNAYDQTEIRTPFWREAIGSFMASEFIRDQFGTAFQHIYGQQKLKEMHSFYTEVTDLEYAWYLRSV